MKTPEALELNTADPHVLVREMTTVEDDQAFWAAIDTNRAHLSQYGDLLGGSFLTRREVTEFREGNPNDMMLAIVREGGFAGSVSLSHDGEIGYWLRRDQLHQGLATMAVQSVVDYFGDRRGRLWARINRKNEDSLAVTRRLGAEQSGQYIDAAVRWQIFEFGGVDQLLAQDEYVTIGRHEPDTLEHRYGYAWAPIGKDSDPDALTGSVVYTIEPYGATPPALVTASGVQTLRVLRGSGLLVYCNGDTKEVEVGEIGSKDGEVDAWRSDGFYLLNHPHARKPLIVRHDGLPAATDGLAQATQILDVTSPRQLAAEVNEGSGLPDEFFRLSMPSTERASAKLPGGRSLLYWS